MSHCVHVSACRVATQMARVDNVRPVSRLGSVRSLCCETGGGHFAFKKRLLEDLMREIVVI